MAKRVIDEPCNIPLYIRVSESMKTDIDRAADTCQMSTSEWLRRAISRELTTGGKEFEVVIPAEFSEDQRPKVERITEKQLMSKVKDMVLAMKKEGVI